MGIAIITGHLGVVGSSIAKVLKSKTNLTIVGIDCDLRSKLFEEVEPLDSKSWADKEKDIGIDFSFNIDIRNREDVDKVFKKLVEKEKIELIVHCAAQPSHDWAKNNVLVDFDINARATIILCETMNNYAKDSILVFLSTNKVYGDNPNKLPLKELEKRFELSDHHHFYTGIDESMSIDNCLHSYFGVSKVAADLYVQEYAKNAGLKTIVLRGGCLTGGRHRGAKLHGFLSYLIKSSCRKETYEVIGHQGKQVRDNLHADDIGRLVLKIFKSKQKIKVDEYNVFNMGGGRDNAVSILEVFDILRKDFDVQVDYTINDNARTGDHIWYITSNEKLRQKFDWVPKISISEIIEDIVRY